MSGRDEDQSPRESALQIVQRLRARGYVAYFAGGSVRDEVLGLSPMDYDVATDATPDEIMRLFRATSAVGISFGVVLVRDFGCMTEVATFRAEDGYDDQRRPSQVRFTDASTDAHRRDFTANALFLDPLELKDTESPGVHVEGVRGRVIDFVGGLNDIRDRVLRAVGVADDRLAEDHLRALRAVRLSARLGFAIEDATAAAIRRHAASLGGVSRERIGDEMRRITSHPSRVVGLRTLVDLGIDRAVLDEVSASNPLLDVVAGMPDEATPPAVLAAWAVDRAGGLGSVDVEDVRGRWRSAMCLSNAECAEFVAVLETAGVLRNSWSASPDSAWRKRCIAGPGFEGALAILHTLEGGLAAAIEADRTSLAADGVGLWPVPAVTGHDLIEAGYTPGPDFRSVLDRVFDAQLRGDVAEFNDSMALARELLDDEHVR